MTIKQLSIFVENKPGRMAEIAGMIAEAGIDIRALSLADTSSFGVLRLIVDRPKEAEAALKDKGLTLSLTDVLAVRMDDRPGGFARVLDALAAGNVNVEYLYAFICRQAGHAAVIIRVEDPEKAAALLIEQGVSMLEQDQVFAE